MPCFSPILASLLSRAGDVALKVLRPDLTAVLGGDRFLQEIRITALAVKVLRREIAATLGSERFSREIDVAARLQHPTSCGCSTREKRTASSTTVMPFVEGESLRDRLAHHGELPGHDAVKLLIEVVDALAHAHQHGVVHRDIKPDNILLSGRQMDQQPSSPDTSITFVYDRLDTSATRSCFPTASNCNPM